MAEIRDLSSPPMRLPDSPARPAARLDAARAAQRAFFQAAMNGAEAPPAPVANPAKPTKPVEAAGAAATATGRYSRPGSLLDIKV